MMSSRACTKCGSRRMDTGVDKDKIAGYQFTTPIYAKRYTCKDCAHAWTEGEEQEDETSE